MLGDIFLITKVTHVEHKKRQDKYCYKIQNRHKGNKSDSTTITTYIVLLKLYRKIFLETLAQEFKIMKRKEL